MKLYTINKDYIDYLKEFDDKVVNVDYNERYKLFVGKIKLQSDNESISYYIPLTSFKSKYNDFDDRLDMIKISDSNKNHFTSALNLNNMIPVPDIAATEFSYDMLRNNNSFKGYTEKYNYYHLAINELKYINEISEKIENNAKAVYSIVKNNNERFKVLKERCCDFVGLYEHAIEYNNVLTSEIEDLMEDITKQFRLAGIGNNDYTSKLSNDMSKEK